MFDILLKHIIAEQAINAMFDNVVRNFSRHSFKCNVGDIVCCSFKKGDIFRYISHGKVMDIHRDAILITFSRVSIDILTGNGSFILESSLVHISEFTHLEVINDKRFA